MCARTMLFDNASFRVTASLIIILLTVSYSNTSFDESQLYKGDPCILKTDGSEGQCVLLEECPSAHHEILERKHPQICIFHKKDIIVCCPKADINSTAFYEYTTTSEGSTSFSDTFNASESTTRKSDTFDTSESTSRKSDTFDASESTTRSSDTLDASESTTRISDTLNVSELSTRINDTLDILESTTKRNDTFDGVENSTRNNDTSFDESTTASDPSDALETSTRINDVVDSSTKISDSLEGIQSSTNTNATLETAASSISSTNEIIETVNRIDGSTNNIEEIFETTERFVNNTASVNSVSQTSVEKCLEYEALYNAKKPKEDNNTPVDGTEAAPNEYPHVALLGYGIEEYKSWHCGGSLISMRHILTAAHCLNTNQLGAPRWVLMGFSSKRASTKCGDVQKFEIAEMIKHPDYKYPSVYNDIAILKLDRDIRLTKAVRPACLNTDEIIPVKEATATGWGLLESNGTPNEILQKVVLDVFDIKQCSRIYSTESKRKLEHGLDSETQLCAGSYFSDMDTCKGDSGGPLQIERKNSPFHSIIGISSFRKGCGVVNMPAIYTKVSNYVPWIESIVWPQN